MAWWYRQYAPNDATLTKLEAEAKAAKRISGPISGGILDTLREDVLNVLMWYSLRASLEPLPSTPSSNIMIIQVLHCPHCQGTDIVRHGNTCQGKPRYRCRECREGRGRTFLLDYSYAGQSPEIKEQIVEMAMNASGIRDTARVLHVSTNTVMTELKKRNLNSTR